MPVRIEVKGGEILEQRLREAGDKLRSVAARAISEFVDMAKSKAIVECPVRTGFLQSTIYRYSMGDFSIYFGASAYYAGFVEFGTRFMRANPFMRRSLSYAESQFQTVFHNIFVEAFEAFR